MPVLQRPVVSPKYGGNILTRHPWWTAASAMATVAVASVTLGYCTAHGESEHSVVRAIGTNEQAPPQPNVARGAADRLQNTNPHGRLACAMVVTHTGPHDSDPYRLQTFITSGTPPNGSHVSYEVTYRFKSGTAHQTGPFTTSIAAAPAIPAVHQEAHFAAVSGQIEGGAQTAACEVVTQ